MKWKKRQREIKRLRAAHAGKQWREPFPDLKQWTGARAPAPCSDKITQTRNWRKP